MGIDVDAKLIVGLEFEDIQDFVESLLDAHGGDLYEGLKSVGLDQASPWYDCGYEYWIIGIEPDIDWDDTDSVGKTIRDAKNQFKEITGKDAKVHITPDVW